LRKPTLAPFAACPVAQVLDVRGGLPTPHR
jgi:hypothetical protein